MNGRRYLFSILALVLFGEAVRADCMIEGRVELPEAPRRAVVNQRYEIVSRGGVVSTNPPLAVVFLEGEFASVPPPGVVELPQKDLAFVPSLLPVQVGTRVEFPNLDDIYHNIFSYSPPKRFDLGRYRPDERPVPSQVFDVPGMVTLRCDIHEHMRGIVLVLATPYFVVTAPDGTFQLRGLPPGRYVLKAWLNSKTTLAKTVELTEGARLRIDFP